jgi:predicted DNA-binding protein YlxM (UPF0122 family)
MGRKKIEINWPKLEGMVMFDASCPTCALEFGISEDTIHKAIKETFKMTFSEYKKLHVGRTVLRLKQRMIKKALDGDNTCLIFSLKNLSTWCDNPDIVVEQEDVGLSFSEIINKKA